MTITDTQSPSSQPELTTSNDLLEPMAKVVLSEDAGQTPLANPLDNKKDESRPLRIYPRSYILCLRESPLVKPPADMPALKDWFGTDNEQNSKKETEPSTSGTARDRRFRHGGTDDGDTPPRPSFRSSLSQPSQMGNFKHQSIRSSDRDRDRGDTDKDRERDIRDKEGQERLRNLSDKYDRERLALPSNLSGLRNKDREAAPHLTPGSSRTSAQTQLGATTSRRTETRDGSRKKAGETSEDWRRGGDNSRAGRDDRVENGRKDRDERERPRSRVRDSSRAKRDPSPKRDRDIDRDRRGERDDHRRERHDRREKDDHPRRERDTDKDGESDDPRRWRDDGKRDERLANRFSERDRDRARDRASHDVGSDGPQERRWNVVEERDGRSKRSSGRDRRVAEQANEGRDRDDRRDREKEKEPAWMDTYIPTSTGGTLGGKGGDGELDGIQAFKKGMKEKEQKDKGVGANGQEHADIGPPAPVPKVDSLEKPLDEIQLFRMMMKREEDKKKSDQPEVSLCDEQPLASSTPNIENAAPGIVRIREHQKDSPTVNGDAHTPVPSVGKDLDGAILVNGGPKPPTPASVVTLPQDIEPATNNSSSLLSLLTSPNDPSIHPSASSLNAAPASRLFPRPLAPEHPPNNSINQDKPPSDAPPSAPGQFNPPPGSRLLAFGARAASTSVGKNQPLPNGLSSIPQLPNGLQPQLANQQLPIQNSQRPPFQTPGMQFPSEMASKSGPPKGDGLRAPHGYTQFEDRLAYGQDPREAGFNQPLESVRRVSGGAPGQPGSYFDQGFSNPSHPQASPADPMSTNGSAYVTGKGSRFAKFFDGKARDAPPGIAKSPTPVNYGSTSPAPGQGQEQGAFNGMIGGGVDNRAMDDLFAMLNNSAQGPRVGAGNQMNPASLTGGIPFGQAHNMHSLQHQIHPQAQHQPSNNRAESLYESRPDDRSFMPDGMVPGLRTNHIPPRNREINGMFSDSPDDHMQFNAQRLPQRGIDPMYSGPAPSLFAQQAGVGRNVGIPSQQPHFRGGPSPISGQNSLQGPPQQRLPPGLANLGGRPPHEPSQYLSMPGISPGGIHGPLHGNGVPQQSFNNFPAGLGYGGPQIRAPPPPSHQMQAPLGHNLMGGMGHPGIDLRGPNQAQLLALSSGLRGGGGFAPQQGPGQMQAPLLAMRHHHQQQQQQPHQQQQAHHLPPHLMPHLLPPHLQQQGLPAPNNQPAHDLMALLMGGTHRE